MNPVSAKTDSKSPAAVRRLLYGKQEREVADQRDPGAEVRQLERIRNGGDERAERQGRRQQEIGIAQDLVGREGGFAGFDAACDDDGIAFHVFNLQRDYGVSSAL